MIFRCCEATGEADFNLGHALLSLARHEERFHDPLVLGPGLYRATGSKGYLITGIFLEALGIIAVYLGWAWLDHNLMYVHAACHF